VQRSVGGVSKETRSVVVTNQLLQFDYEKGVVIIPAAASCRGKGPLPFGVLQTGTVLIIISLWTDSRAVF
jgi:hypothetical protein